jgi:hypothetical protein
MKNSELLLHFSLYKAIAWQKYAKKNKIQFYYKGKAVVKIPFFFLFSKAYWLNFL